MRAMTFFCRVETSLSQGITRLIHLSTHDLGCSREGRILFAHLDVTVRAGEVWRIEGPNGSGKTTLLNVLCGMSSEFEGSISWQQRPLPAARRELQRGVLYLGHRAGVNSALSPLDNLRWYQALRVGISDDAACWQALAEVGLVGVEDLPVHHLSAGQQRRVGLARLRLESAQMWILDEPFTSLDVDGIQQVEAWLARHVSKGGSVVMTTHQPLSSSLPVRRLCLDGAGQHAIVV